MGCWLAKNPVLAGWPRNSGWLAAREFRLAGCCCRRPLFPPPAASVAIVAAPPSAWCGALLLFMANSRQSHYRRGRKKKELRRLRKLTRGQLYDLECRRVHRQRGRDLQEFLWQMHPDRLSDRDRGRFERREARRRQHGALNYTERREARREARRRGQNGIAALDDADAAITDAALAEAGAATAAAAAQSTTATLRAVREEHAMGELIEKEGSSWRVDPGAAPGPSLSPAPAPAPSAATRVLVAKLVGLWDPADGHPLLPDEALVVVATVSELRAFQGWDDDL